MKLLVVSDSHFDRTALSSLLEEIRRRGDIDAVAHLGDMQSDAVWLRAQLDIPVYSVPGNCDMEPNAPAELVIPLDGAQVLLLHGHTRRVKYTLDALAYRARESGAQLALFGHTHARHLSHAYGALLLNPGALKDGRFAIVEITHGDIQLPQFLEL